MAAAIRVAFLGNFGPSFSTESHLALSFESLGVEVTRIQEGDTPALEIPALAKGHDLFFWVQTLGLADTGGTREDRGKMLHQLKDMMPTISYHLDRWMGLEREPSVYSEPFFRADYVFTADGGHEKKWAELGINHHWLPPAVYHAEATDGTPRDEYTSDVAFVGSWRHYAHSEHWPARKKMLDMLRKHYGRRFKCWPVKTAVRGQDLNDLYASVKVIVGDSCTAGSPGNYWSDRIPETTGRGGFLLHPWVSGLQEVHPFLPVNFDMGALTSQIDAYLADGVGRELTRARNAEHTRQNHTYRHRLQTVLDTVPFPF